MKTRYLMGAGLALAVAFGWSQANAQWFPLPSGPMSYYIGGGMRAVGQHEGLRPIRLNEIVQNTQWEFGYQAIAGIRYNFSPNIVFDLDYRYLGTVDPTFRTVGGFKYESEYSSHNLVASLSYRFSPPPPPVVAPPPQPVAYPAPPPPPPPPAVPRVRG